MTIKTLTGIYWSPTGTTKTLTQAVAGGMGAPTVESWDLLQNPPQGVRTFGEEDCLVLGLPVFAGRIPAAAIPVLKQLRGTGTPVVLVLSYGNRHYDDAVLELHDLCGEQGFIVIGAGAFISQHSLFPAIAHSRPDRGDMALVADFASRCAQVLARYPADFQAPHIPGKRPYVAPMKIPFQPKADGSCNGCGACSKLCPTGAISKENPKGTDKGRCISCMACVAVCPKGARRLRSPILPLASKIFAGKCKVRREPEFFL